MNKNELIGVYAELDNLRLRLEDNYNNGVEFVQHEQDKTVIYSILEYINKIIKEW